MRRILASVVVLAVLAVGAPAAGIVYGETTDDYDYVGAVVTVFNTADGPLEALTCTGTLVDADTFLSAAHCFPTWEEIAAFVPPSFTGIDKYAVTFAVDGKIDTEPLLEGDYFLHPDFPGPMSDLRDVAVFELDDAQSIVPATVAPIGYLDDHVDRSDTFTAVGYGTVRETRKQAWQSIGPADGNRRVATQPMLSLTKAWLTLSMNDARDHGGTCYGDSGGPHLHDGRVVSLTVTGDAQCKATDKTYRLDTPLVHDFLREYVDGLGGL